MNRLFRLVLLLLASVAGVNIHAQYSGFSLTSELSIVRSFKEKQQFWGIGPAIKFLSHINPKESFYASFGYYSPERVENRVIAAAKSNATVPSYLLFENTSTISLHQISLGYHRYLKGSCMEESKWNIYGFAGFGIILGKVNNTQSVVVDTSRYTTPVLEGRSGFKRLTVDVGLGTEVNLGGQLYL
ncbi:MAG: hypothetical protein EOO88_61395, partial [Pedobacter sp.]